MAGLVYKTTSLFGKDSASDTQGMDIRPEAAKSPKARIVQNLVTNGGSLSSRKGTVQYANLTLKALNRDILGLSHYRSQLGLNYVVAIQKSGTLTSRIKVYSGKNVVLASNAADITNPPRFCNFAPYADNLFVAGPWDNGVKYIHFDPIDGEIWAEALVSIDRDKRLNELTGQDEGPYGDAPKATIIHSFQERLFLAGVKGSEDTLFWSNLGDPFGYPIANYVTLDSGYRDDIVAIASLFDSIVIFKRKSVWVGSGDFVGSAQTTFHKVLDGIGCASPRSVQVVDGVIYFLSDDGIRVYTGGTQSPLISEPINGLLVAESSWNEFGDDISKFRVNRASLERACSAVYRKLGQYRLWVETDTQGQNNTCFVYHYPTKAWTIDVGNNAISATTTISNDGTEYLLSGDSLGLVVAWDRGQTDWTATKVVGQELVVRAVAAYHALWVMGPVEFPDMDARRIQSARYTLATLHETGPASLVTPYMRTPSANWPSVYLHGNDFRGQANEDFRVLGGATGNAFRLDTDLLLTAGAIQVKAGVTGYKSPSWKVSLSSTINGNPFRIHQASLEYLVGPKMTRGN
jgi:hypothetical protein